MRAFPGKASGRETWGTRRYHLSIASFSGIPLLSLRFHQKRPLRFDPVLQNIFGFRRKREPQPTGFPSLTRSALCVIVLGDLGQYLLGRSQPVLPAGPDRSRVRRFFRAITSRTPLPSTSITVLRSVGQSGRSFGKTPTITLGAWVLLAWVTYGSSFSLKRLQLPRAFSFLRQKQRFFVECLPLAGVLQATPQASSNPPASLRPVASGSDQSGQPRERRAREEARDFQDILDQVLLEGPILALIEDHHFNPLPFQSANTSSPPKGSSRLLCAITHLPVSPSRTVSRNGFQPFLAVVPGPDPGSAVNAQS